MGKKVEQKHISLSKDINILNLKVKLLFLNLFCTKIFDRHRKFANFIKEVIKLLFVVVNKIVKAENKMRVKKFKSSKKGKKEILRPHLNVSISYKINDNKCLNYDLECFENIRQNYSILYTLIKHAKEKNITLKEHEWIYNFILKIKNINVESITDRFAQILNDQSKKIDFICDVDNTLIHAVTKFDTEDISDSINGGQLYQFCRINFNRMKILVVFSFRKGLHEFFEGLKPFCRFHIFTLGTFKYANSLKESLELNFKVKFEKLKTRKDSIKNGLGYTKSIKAMNLNYDNCLVIDDQPYIWEEYIKDNIIYSKKFIDKLLFRKEIDNIYNVNKEKMIKTKEEELFINKYENNKSILLQKFASKYINELYRYFKREKNKFKNLSDIRLNYNEVCDYHEKFTSLNPENIEFSECEICQLNYIPELVKTIYILKNIYDLSIIESLNLIKSHIFVGLILTVAENYC